MEFGEEASLKFGLMAKFFAEFGDLGASTQYKNIEVERAKVHSYAAARAKEHGVAWHKCLLRTAAKYMRAEENRAT